MKQKIAIGFVSDTVKFFLHSLVETPAVVLLPRCCDDWVSEKIDKIENYEKIQLQLTSTKGRVGSFVRYEEGRCCVNQDADVFPVAEARACGSASQSDPLLFGPERELNCAWGSEGLAESRYAENHLNSAIESRLDLCRTLEKSLCFPPLDEMES